MSLFLHFFIYFILVYKMDICRLQLTVFQCHCRGVWNVPHISATYLIQKQVLSEMKGIFTGDQFDPDMTMCKNLREKVSSDLPFLK